MQSQKLGHAQKGQQMGQQKGVQIGRQKGVQITVSQFTVWVQTSQEKGRTTERETGGAVLQGCDQEVRHILPTVI